MHMFAFIVLSPCSRGLVLMYLLLVSAQSYLLIATSLIEVINSQEIAFSKRVCFFQRVVLTEEIETKISN